MKKIISLLSTTLLLVSLQAQSINNFLSGLEDGDDYGVVTINKEMFKMISAFDVDLGDDEDAIRDLIRDINKVRVFINEENGTYDEYKEIKGIAQGSSMENLVSVKSGGERVDLFTNPTNSDNIVEGLLLLVREGSQNVFIHIDGKINLKHLAMLTEKLDIDGLEYLNKVGEDN